MTATPDVTAPTRPSVADIAGRWWVALTQSQYESRLVSDLTAAGVDSYLPLVSRVNVSPSGQRQRRLVPLFGPYVFFAGDGGARYEAAKSRATLSIIDVAAAAQKQLVGELVAIERSLAAGMTLDRYADLKVGTRCRVRCGPMQGTEGVLILRPDGGKAFVLVVTLLGQAVTMDVPPEMLEALN